jgi:hypothetical protein
MGLQISAATRSFEPKPAESLALPNLGGELRSGVLGSNGSPVNPQQQVLGL